MVRLPAPALAVSPTVCVCRDANSNALSLSLSLSLSQLYSTHYTHARTHFELCDVTSIYSHLASVVQRARRVVKRRRQTSDVLSSQRSVFRLSRSSLSLALSLSSLSLSLSLSLSRGAGRFATHRVIFLCLRLVFLLFCVPPLPPPPSSPPPPPPPSPPPPSTSSFSCPLPLFSLSPVLVGFSSVDEVFASLLKKIEPSFEMQTGRGGVTGERGGRGLFRKGAVLAGRWDGAREVCGE